MNNIEIKFGLRKITTVQFATIDSVEIKQDDIKLNFGFGFGLNEEHRLVGCNARFEFISKGNAFIILTVLCDYEISPDSWKELINEEQKSVIVPVSIATHFAFLTVGTARGILHGKTENTDFNKFFIPTLNISTVLKDDIVIPIQKPQ